MKTIKYIRFLLYPIALLYGLMIRARNLLFNIEILKSEKFPVPIISVGNITVGGTGKTPLTEFIIKILKEDYQVALLSRGYKRLTKGFVLANAQSTAADIGDEPKQILDKFADITVAVSEKRVRGINGLLTLPKAPDVIVMDDAYQHRYVKPGLSILVMDYSRPLWRDLMLPAGELREPMNGKKRANIILISKCPKQISADEQRKFISKIKSRPHQQVYFSTIAYQAPCLLFGDNNCNIALKDASVLLVTGIANPVPFEKYVRGISKAVKCISYPDHYLFNANDIVQITKRFNETKCSLKYIVTTEKDAVRLRQIIKRDSELAGYICYIPIQIELLNDKQQEFTQKIKSYVDEDKRNS